MKILGIVGSNRKNGNSYLLLKEMFGSLSSHETKIIQIAGLRIKPCELCFDECAKKPFECDIDDDFRFVFDEMKSADGMVMVCPFYFYVPSKFQPFLERLSCLDYSTLEKHGEGHNPLVGKPCLNMVVSASGSSFNAFQMLHHLQELCLMLRMRPVTTKEWPFIGFHAKTGGINNDDVMKQTQVLEEAKKYGKLLIDEIADACGR